MELTELIPFLKAFGPFAGACVFFVWRDWKREDRLTKRVEHLENEQTKVLLPLVKETAEIIAKNTTVMERLEKSLQHRS